MSVFDVISNSCVREIEIYELFAPFNSSNKNELFASMPRNEDRDQVQRHSDLRFHELIDSLPREDGMIIRYSAESGQRIWEDLHHCDADRLLSKREGRRTGPSCSPVRICVDFADFRLTEKCFVLATFSLQLQYLVACRLDFCRKRKTI